MTNLGKMNGAALCGKWEEVLVLTEREGCNNVDAWDSPHQKNVVVKEEGVQRMPGGNSTERKRKRGGCRTLLSRKEGKSPNSAMCFFGGVLNYHQGGISMKGGGRGKGRRHEKKEKRKEKKWTDLFPMWFRKGREKEEEKIFFRHRVGKGEKSFC